MGSIEDINNQINKFNEDVEDISDRITETDKELNKLYQSNQDFERVISKIDALCEKEKSLAQQIDRITSTTKIIHRPAEELQEMLNNSANWLAEKRRDAEVKTKEISLVEGQLSTVRNKFLQNSTKEGQLKAQLEQYKKNQISKTELINSIVAKFEVADASKLEEAMDKYSKRLTENYNKKLAEIQEADEGFNFEITSTREHIASLSQQEKHFLADIQTHKAKKSTLENNLTSIRSNESKLQSYKSKLSQNENELNRIREENKTASIMKQISNCKLEIQGYESKLEEIQSQMASARAHAAILSKVKYLKEFMEDLKRKKEDGIITISDDYRSVFSRSFDFDDEFKMKFDSKVGEVTQLYDMSFKKIDEYKENVRKVSDELNRVTESRKNVVTEYSRIENLLKAIHRQYVKLYEDDISFIEFVTDYSGLLEDTELSHKEDESK
ncbi:unnamed protein product [Ambrosiozyma monospora]|uniref:Unnamed protein product n=1 Tax=Ambrosiozyma monospora TaxID=43982 RepID=A0A9W6Z7V5_AMBMO|nr:unnamed protein product [Ambrosiozyma monospora]